MLVTKARRPLPDPEPPTPLTAEERRVARAVRDALNALGSSASSDRVLTALRQGSITQAISALDWDTFSEHLSTAAGTPP